MGGFGTALAGALEGVSGAMVREHKETLDADIRNRQAAQAMWQHILTDPDAPPEQKQHAFASFMGIATTPPGKNWNKFTKPYERAQQQPGQQLPPMQMGGGPQGAPVAPPPPPSPMLAPGSAASPGPQAPIAAAGGASPGVLQGGANQLPPMQPMAPPPPPDAPAPDPSSVGAMPPATIPGATIPPVTGPAVPTPMSIPGHGAAMALQSQLKARYDAAVAMGASPEQARMSALGLTGLMRPTPVNVLTTGGQTVVASKHIDPATGTVHFYGSEGNDITPSVVREIGLAVIPKAEVLFGANRVPFAIKHPDGTVVPVGDAALTDDDKHLLASAQPRPMTTTRTGSESVDEHGNKRTSGSTTRSVSGASSVTPPPPPPGATPPSRTSRGTPSPTASASGTPAKTKYDQDRTDRSYQAISKTIDTVTKPIEDLYARFGRLKDTIGQSTPQADALVAPELLTVMAGGQGSGLRMNEAEIARIVGGRSKWQDLQAAVNKWKTDPTAALSITPEQRQQIRALADTVGQKLAAKQSAVNDARDRLIRATSPDEHRQIYADLKKSLAAIDQGQQPTATSTAGAPHPLDDEIMQAVNAAKGAKKP